MTDLGLNITVPFSICVAVICFTLTALTLKKLIPILKGRKIGQKILEIGPRWHMSKEGTPTMGGLGFIIPFIVLFVVATVCVAVIPLFGKTLSVSSVITALFAVVNGAIGIIDDRTKFANNRNEGLTAGQKFSLQTIAAVAYIAAMRIFGGLTTEIYIPFADKLIDFGLYFYPLALILILGIVNSVNLADGIDGLAATETAVCGIFFTVCAVTAGTLSGALLPALTVGCTLGFLVYNFYPARVFMGDTGSLFLGALVVGIAFSSKSIICVIPVGIMYIAESVSDILQVGYFKLTHGKRLFKMAPIHHHFEKCGWSEIKIVTVFSLITLLMCVITYIVYFI